MTRMKIFGKRLTESEIDAVKALVDESGNLVDQIEVVTLIGEPDPDGEDEAILMLATPDTCSDPDLGKELEKSPNGGHRVIWIWTKDAETADMPAAANKYCYSVIPWNADRLRAVAADDDATCFEQPNGEPLPIVPTDRNLCVR